MATPSVVVRPKKPQELGISSTVALALGGLYHGYRPLRNHKVNEALKSKVWKRPVLRMEWQWAARRCRQR